MTTQFYSSKVFQQAAKRDAITATLLPVLYRSIAVLLSEHALQLYPHHSDPQSSSARTGRQRHPYPLIEDLIQLAETFSEQEADFQKRASGLIQQILQGAF